MSFFRTYWNSPVGPKTTHFWGPMANWGFVAAALADLEKPPEMVSGNMTSVMCVYSALCMRFAWMVRPRNYLLLGCHMSNETVQLFQLSRWARGQGYLQQKEDKTPITPSPWLQMVYLISTFRWLFFGFTVNLKLLVLMDFTVC